MTPLFPIYPTCHVEITRTVYAVKQRMNMYAHNENCLLGCRKWYPFSVEIFRNSLWLNLIFFVVFFSTEISSVKLVGKTYL